MQNTFDAVASSILHKLGQRTRENRELVITVAVKNLERIAILHSKTSSPKSQSCPSILSSVHHNNNSNAIATINAIIANGAIYPPEKSANTPIT